MSYSNVTFRSPIANAGALFHKQNQHLNGTGECKNGKEGQFEFNLASDISMNRLLQWDA